jgi:chromosome segregation ATPase
MTDILDLKTLQNRVSALESGQNTLSERLTAINEALSAHNDALQAAISDLKTLKSAPDSLEARLIDVIKTAHDALTAEIRPQLDQITATLAQHSQSIDDLDVSVRNYRVRDRYTITQAQVKRALREHRDDPNPA